MQIIGKNSKWLTAKFDLIAELRRVTIDAHYFDPDQWCEYDADILDRAAKMIRREIAEAKKKEAFADKLIKKLIHPRLKATPIAATPTLEEEDAMRFLREVAENVDKPSYPCGDPERLEEARQKFLRDYPDHEEDT